MTDVARILNARTITESDAEALLAAYPEIGELLAGIAVKREQTHRTVEISRTTPAEIVRNWQQSLTGVSVGYVFYEASGMSQFGRTMVSIDRRSGELVVKSW